MKKISLLLPITSALALALPLLAADDFPPMPPAVAVSPEEELKTMQLPPGYHLELVLSEPDIKEPVVCAFDGDGRMFVAEMRSYMQDIDGHDELTPVSRVSLHWSSKGDGVLDKHTVFADKLLLPRMILPLDKGRVVIGETNTLDLYLYTDTDGDGVSDKKELWWEGGARGGNLEHQPSGLLWAIDNGIYTTYNSFRLRWTPTGVLREPSGNNGGQWGLGQDNHGKLFFMNAGGERGPLSFQVPVVYGAFRAKGEFAPGFDEVWPLVGRADVQGGTSRFRPADKTLNHFTATSGAEIYRGDRLPEEVRGNLFFGEPVGRLVRRAKVDVVDGTTVLSNPYQAEKSEFIRSTDACFRPLNMTTAPDGTLYIVDMYRGIIQEGNWVAAGSYLRKVVQQYSFDKVTGHGRIWRLVHDTTKRGPQPQMLEEKPAQLVAHLAHPNGWWRDAAQKLLILKQDKSVVPALVEMAGKNANYLARLHALWTLEGLDALTPAIVRTALKDAHPQVRIGGVRVSESLFKKGGEELMPDVLAMAKDKEPEVAMQTFLTANLLKWKDAPSLIESTIASTPAAGVKEIGEMILHPQVQQTAQVKFTPAEKKTLAAGAEIYNTLCTACHGPDGKGLPMVGGAPGVRLAPALAGAKDVVGPREGPIFVLLHGLSGDIDGKRYEGQMIPMATNNDVWIASVLSFVRNSFGNSASFITPEEVAHFRTATRGRTQPWTYAELRAALPRELDRKGWKVTASDRPGETGLAIDGKADTRYTTGAYQKPGMWLQIELPAATEISGILLDSAKSANDYPRGYTVQLSTDGKAWSPPVAIGKGSGPVTQIEFAPATAKFIRINQTGSVNGLFWSIHELQIYASSKR